MATKILATASYVPETRRTNQDLERMLGTDVENGGTTDKWIMERVGIKERRITQPHESHQFMTISAVKSVLNKSGIDPKQTSIILAGNTHITGAVPCIASQYALEQGMVAFDIVGRDVSYAGEASRHLFKSYTIKNEDGLLFAENGTGNLGTAVIYQHRKPALAQVIASELGMNAERSYDVVTGCASYNFALALADATIREKPQNIIVAAVDKMHGVVDEKDPRTIVLFGELASATALGPSSEEGFVAHYLETEGKFRDLITIKKKTPDGPEHFYQEGRAVYKWAVPKIKDLTQKAVREAAQDIVGGLVFIVPHQANPRMLYDAMEREKELFKNLPVIVTGDMFGNSSTASIAHALDVLLTEGVMFRDRKIKPSKGDYIGIEGFGAGLSSAVNVYRVT